MGLNLAYKLYILQKLRYPKKKPILTRLRFLLVFNLEKETLLYQLVTPPEVKPGLCVRLGPIKNFLDVNQIQLGPNRVPTGSKTAVRDKYFLEYNNN